MAEMTREEVEERLEEYAAHKALEDAHEGTEDPLLEASNEKIPNDEGDSQDSAEGKEDETGHETSAEVDAPQDETEFQDDKKVREKLISAAGEQSISIEQLTDVLQQKDIFKNIEMVEGDITTTVPDYIATHPELKISLLNLDVDIYEPSVIILEHLYSRIVKGGVLVLDDYGTFPGETKAVDDFFKDQEISIRKFPYCTTPSYIIKD